MQSSMSGQAPSQAFQSNKRRRLVPTIDPDMIEPLNRFSDMLADMNSDDPVIRSRAAAQLTVLSPLMQQLAFAKNAAGVHYAARDFKTLGVACIFWRSHKECVKYSVHHTRIMERSIPVPSKCNQLYFYSNRRAN